MNDNQGRSPEKMKQSEDLAISAVIALIACIIAISFYIN